ncbi:hypothetical protein [Egbenema bharatensis]|uniref:hypothetical protein n=1 Tax=Egbenema bharatensis TaxID=3463334 RepID=UPI003A8A86A5
MGIVDRSLRFFLPDGSLVPTPEESAQAEQRQRQEAERQRQEAERQVTEMAALLEQYRQQFGDLPHRGEVGSEV